MREPVARAHDQRQFVFNLTDDLAVSIAEHANAEIALAGEVREDRRLRHADVPGNLRHVADAKPTSENTSQAASRIALSRSSECASTGTRRETEETFIERDRRAIECELSLAQRLFQC